MSSAQRTLVSPRRGSATVLAEEIEYADPVALLAAFADDRHAALLDGTGAVGGRYSFVAAEPFRVLTSRNGRVAVDGRPAGDGPFDALRAELARHRIEPDPDLPPFQGGAVGYLGYELGRQLERVPPARGGSGGFPDLALMLCDVVVAIDHELRRAWICSSGLPEHDPEARRARAAARLADTRARLASAPELGEPATPLRRPPIAANFTRAHYEWAVRRVIDYILAGDIFQANLAQRFAADLPPELDPLDLYRRLRARSPAPFSAFLRLGEVALASSSPERFLRVSGRRVETSPIKGTRRRGRTPAEDEELARELAASAKDRAENVMIVDLLRNDLSRVCRDGAVEVPRLCGLERFATVMHLVSTVTGELRADAGPADVLAACFPGGSVTGAPKIRAMEIIAELEPHRRGPYCGALGYLGFDGALDTSIVIRTYAIRGRRVTFHAGGAVVADSDPADEYEETMVKAHALSAALGP